MSLDVLAVAIRENSSIDVDMDYDGQWTKTVLTKGVIGDYAAYEGPRGWPEHMVASNGNKIPEEAARLLFADIIKPDDRYRGIVMSFKLTKQSMLTGKIHEMVLPVDGDKLLAWMRKPKGQRQLIQDEFPELDADQREFIMTGATKEEWDATFGDEDGEEAA